MHPAFDFGTTTGCNIKVKKDKEHRIKINIQEIVLREDKLITEIMTNSTHRVSFAFKVLYTQTRKIINTIM